MLCDMETSGRVGYTLIKIKLYCTKLENKFRKCGQKKQGKFIQKEDFVNFVKIVTRHLCQDMYNNS